MRGLTILVTGGAGFIGSATVRRLITTGHRVVNLDKLSYAGTLASLQGLGQAEGHYFVRGDICDRPLVERILAIYCPDRVLHLAAESHVDRSIAGAGSFIETNVVGTFHLLEAVRGYFNTLEGQRRRDFRFHHVSTDEVFGSLGEAGAFYEETRYNPTSPYSASKAASDHLVRAWYSTYGLPTIVSNCSNNYGPYQFPEKLIPLTILNALEGKELPVYGTGNNVRDWLFVDDHARALEMILLRGVPGETYCVGGAGERTNIELVGAVCALLDWLRPGKSSYRDRIRFVSDRPGHDLRYAIDASKLARELCWAPEESVESGLEKTVRWYLDNEWWWRPLREPADDECQNRGE